MSGGTSGTWAAKPIVVRRSLRAFGPALLLSLVAFAPHPAAAQQNPATAKPTGYTVFLRGAPVGREELTVREDATGTTITAQGRLGAPLNVVTRRAEMKYTADGTPERFSLEGSANGAEVSVRTLPADAEIAP